MTAPTLAEIETAAERLRGVTIETPTVCLSHDRWGGALPDGADVTVKLELFQQAGSFKARGAYLGISGLMDAEKAKGVIAASGGNHALAVSWAAKAAGVKATIAMPKSTDPLRVEGCKALGATVVLTKDMPAAFALMEQGAEQGQTMMHPFEAPHMILGAATCGLEIATQISNVDVYVIPVGGGGLIAGMSCAIKQMTPQAIVIGVEPTGADSMTRSIAAKEPVTLDRIDTIADSLGSPKALPLSFGVAQANVDRMVHVTDDELRQGMRDYAANQHILAEPACAAALAAVCGPLKDELTGKRVGIIACGSNIGLERFTTLTATSLP